MKCTENGSYARVGSIKTPWTIFKDFFVVEPLWNALKMGHFLIEPWNALKIEPWAQNSSNMFQRLSKKNPLKNALIIEPGIVVINAHPIAPVPLPRAKYNTYFIYPKDQIIQANLHRVWLYKRVYKLNT